MPRNDSPYNSSQRPEEDENDLGLVDILETRKVATQKVDMQLLKSLV